MTAGDSIADLPRLAARRFGAVTAIVEGESTDVSHASFAAIDALSEAFGRFLKQGGLAPGDRVILYGDNAINWVIAYYGILKVDGVVVPANKLLTPAEIAYIAEHSAAKWIIGTAVLLDAVADLDIPNSVAWDRDDGVFTAALQQGGAPHGTTRGGDDVAAICYTSGTTGRPKGAALTHRNILTNAILTATMHGKTEHDVMVSALPCPHVYGNVIVHSAFLTGARLILFSQFDPDTILNTLERENASVFEGVPTMYYYLLNENLEARDLTQLRLLTVGGQSMPVPRLEEVIRRFGAPLVELWGMTELAGLGTTHAWLSGACGAVPLGSIGVTLPGIEARIASLDDPHAVAAPGEAGELQIRGPVVMQGYWQDAAATAEVIDPDGWLSTGDVATKDQQGFLRIVDRKKDMILTAGYNIYPAEVEAVISQHKAVAMCAVASEPDALKGTIPVAHVVCKPGVHIDSEALIAHCRQSLAAYKVPRRVVFTDDLPKTSSGKIMRRALKVNG